MSLPPRSECPPRNLILTITKTKKNVRSYGHFDRNQFAHIKSRLGIHIAPSYECLNAVYDRGWGKIVNTSTDLDAQPCHCTWLNHRTLYSGKRQKLEKCSDDRYTYDGNNPADIRKPFIFQHPNSITEVFLNDERDNSGNEGNVYGGEMRMRKASHVAESSNKPIVNIRPSEASLNSLHDEDEISCSKFALTWSQNFRVTSKTDLKI